MRRKRSNKLLDPATYAQMPAPANPASWLGVVFKGIILSLVVISGFRFGFEIGFAEFYYSLGFFGYLVFIGIQIALQIFLVIKSFQLLSQNNKLGILTMIALAFFFGILFNVFISYLFILAALYDVTINAGMVQLAIVIVFTVTIVSYIMAPRLNTERASKFIVIMLILMASMFLMFTAGWFLSLFGITFLLDLYYNVVWGIGPLGLAYTAGIIVMYAYFLTFKFRRAQLIIDSKQASSDLEWAIAYGILVDILMLFYYVMRLLIKLAARNQ